MMEKASSSDGEQAAVTDKTNGDPGIDADDVDKGGVAVPPALLFSVNNDAVATDNNHPQRTIEHLQDQGTQLETIVV